MIEPQTALALTLYSRDCSALQAGTLWIACGFVNEHFMAFCSQAL